MRRLALALVAVVAVGCGQGGEAGPKGPAGAPGTNGAVAVFDVQNQNVTGISSGGAIAQWCQAGPFTAGAGQTALVWVASQVFMPTGTALTDIVRFSVDGGATWSYASQNFKVYPNTGAAGAYVNAEDFAAISLGAGTTYTFAAGTMVFSGAGVTGATGSCRTMVEIVAQ